MAKIEPVSLSEEHREPSRVIIYLNKEEQAVEGLADIGLGKEVTVTIKGTVKSLDNREWMDGVDITITPSAVQISADDKVITLDDAIAGAQRTV
jgi:hypothetical protein